MALVGGEFDAILLVRTIMPIAATIGDRRPRCTPSVNHTD
jgi:hypothetical protein